MDEERIVRLEGVGVIDPYCKICQEMFYPAYKIGGVSVFAPSHKQKLNNVSITYMLASGTIDEYLTELVEVKRSKPGVCNEEL
jgi:hypothetical protein